MRTTKVGTNEGGIQHDSTGNKLLEFFSKAGSAFIRRPDKGSFYPNGQSALQLFKDAWSTGRKTIAMKLAFWCRDPRGGAGNRSGSREIFSWLAGGDDAHWLLANLHLIAPNGRWDDLRSLFSTPLSAAAADVWAKALATGDVLAAKWADRSDKPLLFALKRMGLVSNEAGLRKLLSGLRKEHIVEAKMCAQEWRDIEYKTVPSVALSRYTNAFAKHDPKRWASFKEKVKKGEVKVHAGALFPHDCLRTARNGDADMADLQFEALPDYMSENEQRLLVLCDTSGSMQTPIAGEIQAVDISMSLALYCSDKMGKDNPFYRKFLGFESEASFKDWTGMTMSQAIQDRRIFDGACGATNIGKALDYILKHAIVRRVKKNQMPTALLVISDMQFHQGSRGGSGTEVNRYLDAWEQAGYDRPRVIYWNVSPYSGSPETSQSKDVALISGFSPAILKSVLTAEEVSPLDVMLAAIEKYEVVEPKASDKEKIVLSKIDSDVRKERKAIDKKVKGKTKAKAKKPSHWLADTPATRRSTVPENYN